MLTVVFATRNRAASLQAVLQAFIGLDAVPGRWKLVVVDNGSADATAEILDKFRNCLPLEVVRERRSGKSRALNRAVAAFDGDLVVATDDDVLPQPGWLVALRRAADLHPETTMFGGAILPAWQIPPPPWLLDAVQELPALYALIDRPSGRCDYRAVFGPNMALRRAVFDQGMRFAEHIGPDGGDRSYPMGSEWEFTSRLHQAGHRGWFVSEARVRHLIRPEQLTESWMLGRAYRNGLGIGLTAPPRCSLGPPRLTGLPSALLVRRFAWACLGQGAALLPPSHLRLRLRFRDRWFAGLAEATRRRAGGAGPTASATRGSGLLAQGPGSA